MTFYRHIQPKYLVLVPALYFAIIGSFDIISDATAHKLTTANFLFNLIFFIPLTFRHWRVYIASGVLAILFTLYGFFALLVWINKYLNGGHFRYPFDTFVIAPIFCFLTLLLGLSLVYGGRQLSRNSGSTR